jgi:hypothetical protein
MTQYEEILSKIAPIFYKVINYREYFNESSDIIFQYLLYIQKRVNKKIPDIDTLWLPDPNFPELGLHYFMNAYRPRSFLEERITNYRTIVFTKASKLHKYDVTLYVYIDQFVINLVINRFSFENEYPLISFFGSPADCTYKDLFVALVGKDTYDTIRANLK